MALPPVHIDYGSFLLGERLRVDGKNLVAWTQSLRDALAKNGLRHMMHYRIGEEPGWSAEPDVRMEFYTRRAILMNIDSTMKSMMEPELRAKINH